MVDEVRAKYAEQAVYSPKECEEVKDFITTQIDSLYDKISHLKGQQCLAALIRYYETDSSTLDHEITEVADYLERNRQAGGLYISLQIDSTARELEGLCDRAVLVEYVQEEQPDRKPEYF